MSSKTVFGDVVNASRVKSDSMIQSNGSKGGESFLPWCYDRLVRPGRWCTVGKRGAFQGRLFGSGRRLTLNIWQTSRRAHLRKSEQECEFGRRKFLSAHPFGFVIFSPLSGVHA